MGPGKDTHGTPVPEREGRGWSHNTIHSATNAHNQKTDTTVAEPCLVQSSQPGSSSEQDVDELGKKLTDSLWAVASNSDREHKETRQAGGPDSRVRSSSTKSRNEIVHLVEDEQCPAQSPRNTSSTQWRWKSPTPLTRREKSIYRQEVQRWIGHEPATNHCERIRSSRGVNRVTEQIKTHPRFSVYRNEIQQGAVYRQD